LIAIDTSALLAITLGEPESSSFVDVMEAESIIVVSAGTLAEALIVATGQGARDDVLTLFSIFRLHVEEVTPASARRIGEIYQRWGKGFHRASLNFGDCFAYELAERHGCPLLYKGNDFARTDIRSAL
jgi:ribonuclease VapC